MEKKDVPFVSIARTGYATEWDVPIYKVFSRTKLDDEFFNQTFNNISGQLHQEWKESAVSTMETEAVSARNAANLTIEYLTGEIQD